MKLYRCKVLLHGDILFQVPKEMVTAAEIRILRGIHVGNNDPVIGIELMGETTRSDALERARLANTYGQDAFSLDGEVSVSGTQLVNTYFPPGVALPQELAPQQMDDEKRHSPLDEVEQITLIDPATGVPQTVAAPAAAVAIMEGASSIEDDPFRPERESIAAAPKLEPASSLGLRSARRTVAAGV